MADNTLGTDAFEQLVALLDYPMYVVTTRTGEESAGCLVGFTSQVSIRPRRFLVGLSKRNHTYRVARRSEHLPCTCCRAGTENLPGSSAARPATTSTSSLAARGGRDRRECRFSPTRSDGSSVTC